MVRGFAAEADPERLVGSIAEEALRLLNGDRVALARWNPQTGLLSQIATLRADGTAQPAGLANPASLAQAVEQRRPVVINHPATGRGRPKSRERAEVAAPLMDEDRLIGAIAVTSRDQVRRFGLEDAELLEVLAGLAAATIVGHEEARREGVLLSARTAQHEVNNRLSLVRGYGEIIADHPDLPDDIRHPAREIVRASTAAADILRRLGKLDALREIAWGPGLRPTLDLTDPAPPSD
jgi:GAF domain-containing protein